MIRRRIVVLDSFHGCSPNPADKTFSVLDHVTRFAIVALSTLAVHVGRVERQLWCRCPGSIVARVHLPGCNPARYARQSRIPDLYVSVKRRLSFLAVIGDGFQHLPVGRQFLPCPLSLRFFPGCFRVRQSARRRAHPLQGIGRRESSAADAAFFYHAAPFLFVMLEGGYLSCWSIPVYHAGLFLFFMRLTAACQWCTPPRNSA